MSREIGSNSNYQLRPEDYPEPKDVQEVNELADNHPDGFIDRFLNSKRAGLFVAVPMVGLVGSIQAQDIAEEAARTVPAGIVRGVDWALGGTQVAHADGATPTPNPNYISDDEEPNPSPPPVVEDGGDVNNDPQLTPAPNYTHEESYQLVHKEMFDSNGNRLPEWGTDAPWDQQFRYWEDFNRNRWPDAGEGLQSNLRTGPDGVEVIRDSVMGDVEGVSICVEDTNIDSNVVLVTPAVQCADVNPVSLTVEIQSLVENKKVTPTPAPPTPAPEQPTPTPVQPTPTPEEVGPTPTPEQPTPTPEGTPGPAPVSTPAPTEGPKPTPTPTPAPEIPKVCVLPGGKEVQLPPEFQAQLIGKDAETIAAMIREFKCQFEGHVQENIDSHDAIKDAVGLGPGEMPIDEQIGVKPGELSIADRIDNLPTLPEIEGAVGHGPDWLTRGLLIGGLVGGTVLGYLGLRSITSRLDRLVDRGQPPAGSRPPEGGSESEGPEGQPPRRGWRNWGPIGWITGIFGGKKPEKPKDDVRVKAKAEAEAEAKTGKVQDQVAVAAVAEKTDGEQVREAKKEGVLLSEAELEAMTSLLLALMEGVDEEKLDQIAQKVDLDPLRNLLGRLGVPEVEKLSPAQVIEKIADVAYHSSNLAARAVQKAVEQGGNAEEVRGKLHKALEEVHERQVAAEEQAEAGVVPATAGDGKPVGVDKDAGEGGAAESPEVGGLGRVRITFEGGFKDVAVGMVLTRKSGLAYRVEKIGQDGDTFTVRQLKENKERTLSKNQMAEIVRDDREREIRDGVRKVRQQRVDQGSAGLGATAQ